MKVIERPVRLLAVLILLLALSACSLPASDKLTCVLPNGDTVTIVGEYEFSVIAKVLQPISGHLSERINKGYTKVYYQSASGRFKSKVEVIGAGGGTEGIRTEEGRRKNCSGYLLIDGTVSLGRALLLPNETEFRIIEVPQSIQFPRDIKEVQPRKAFVEAGGRLLDEEFKKKLSEMGLGFSGYEYLSKIGNLIAYESMLHKTNIPQEQNPTGTLFIGGVFRSTSSDNGKTWNEPVISTTDSFFFNIGKTIDDPQPGRAKPGKFSIGPGR